MPQVPARMAKYDDYDVLRPLFACAMSPVVLLSPAHISSQAQKRLSNKGLLKVRQ